LVRFVLFGLVATACAAFLIPLPAVAVERFYSGLIYPPVQRALTSFSNLVPLALFDILIVGFPAVWGVLAVRDIARSRRRLQTAGRWGLRTVAAAALLYLVFLMTWGLNYRREPLDRKLKYDANAVTSEAARDAATLTVSRLNALYAPAHAAGDRTTGDAALAAAFARTTKELGGTGTTVPGRPKQTILDLYFRPAAVAGMTDPFFLETLVESNLLEIERPFVVAHEWSHLAGFADEGEANFAGWLTCTRADALSQYSGWLSLFGELMNSVPRADRAAVMASLGGGPRQDLREIAARLARDVKPRVSAAGWRVYNEYLKANRVEAGTASYAQVVRLVLGTRLGLNDEAALPAR
jgi:hypothetical protein